MGGNDGWAGMVDGRGWRKDEKALLPWPRAIAFGRVASVFMANQFVIPARGVIPTEGGIPADAVALRELAFPREP